VNLTTVSGTSLIVEDNSTYTPGGTLTIPGNFYMYSGTTFNGGANAITLGGNFQSLGTFTHTGTITFNNSSSTATSFDVSNTIGSDLVVATTGTGGVYAGNALNIGANNLTINTGGIFQLVGEDFTMSGTFSNDGTFKLRGNETVTLTQDTNSGTWEYGGLGGQSQSYTIKDFGATDYYNLLISAGFATGMDTFSSGAAKVVAGTFTINGNGSQYFSNGFALTVTGLTTMGAGIFNTGSATNTFNAGLTQTGGSIVASTGTVDINGNYTQTSGGVSGGSGNITVSGNWLFSTAGFTPGTSTVIFDPSVDHTITGANTWYNLTFTEASNNTVDSVITFPAGVTQTVTGTLVMDGLDANDQLNIVSSSTGTAATIAFTGTSTFSSAARNFLDVRDNTLSDSSSGVTLPINPTSSTNTGNTIGWFPAPNGILRPNEGLTSAAMNGKTIRLLKNGIDTGLTATTANNANGGGLDGEFSFLTPTGIVAGDVLTLYVDNDATVDAVTVTVTDASTYSFELIQNYLIVRHENGASITNANLDTGNNGDSDITAIYSDGGVATLTTQSAKSLLVNTGDTYAPGGTMNLGNGIHVMSTATFSGGANAISVVGNLDNDGTWTHTGTITFSGTSQTFNPGSSAIGSDISVLTGSSTYVIDNALNIGANTLTIGSGAVFNLGGKNLTISSTFSNDGTLELFGSETITSLTQDTNSGTWSYVGDSDGVAENVTIKDWGATDYYNLKVNDVTAVSDTFRLGANTKVANDFTVTDGAFSALAQVMDVDGDFFIDTTGTATASSSATALTIGGDFTNNGSFVHNSGTITLDGTDHTITVGSVTRFNKLYKTDTINDGIDDTVYLTNGIEIASELKFDGIDSDDRINIRSNVSGTQRSITMVNASTFSAANDYLDIKDSAIQDLSSAFTIPVNPANSINSGNTSGWFYGSYFWNCIY
jgi:hypothetical protein